MIEVETTLKSVRRKLDEVDDRLTEAEHPVALAAGKASAFSVSEAIRQTLTKNPSGKLAQSVEVEQTREGVQVGPTLPHGPIQQTGGVVHAKGKKLAVPLSFANVPPGKGPRDFGDLKVIPRKGKDTLLAKASGRELQPVFVLKDQVRIEGVDYLGLAARSGEPQMANASEDAIKDALKGALDA